MNNIILNTFCRAALQCTVVIGIAVLSVGALLLVNPVEADQPSKQKVSSDDQVPLAPEAKQLLPPLQNNSEDIRLLPNPDPSVGIGPGDLDDSQPAPPVCFRPPRLKGMDVEERCKCDLDMIASQPDSCEGWFDEVIQEWIPCSAPNACTTCVDAEYPRSCCCYDNCSVGSNYFDGIVNTFGIHNGYLLAGGDLSGLTPCHEQGTEASCVNAGKHVAVWDVVTERFEWLVNDALEISHLIGVVNGIASFNGDLYVGGGWNGCMDDPEKYCIHGRMAKWGCGDWEPVGGGVVDDGLNDEVNALAVYNGELYAGGRFTDLNGENNNTLSHIAKWDGNQWMPVGGGVGKTSYANPPTGGYFTSGGQVEVLKVIENVPGIPDGLYVGGYINGALNIPGDPDSHVKINGLARWDGTEWSSVANIDPSYSNLGTVYDFAVFNQELYVGGYFSFIAADPPYSYWSGIAKLEEGSWVSVSTGVYNEDMWGWVTGSGTVRALSVYDDGRGEALYVGGNFETAGGVVHNGYEIITPGVEANGIAKWNGRKWSSVDGGLDEPYRQANAFITFDVGEGLDLIIGGAFGGFGGAGTQNIARLDGCLP